MKKNKNTIEHEDNFDNDFYFDDQIENVVFISEFELDYKNLRDVVFSVFAKNEKHPLYVFFKNNNSIDEIDEEKEKELNDLLDKLYDSDKDLYFKIFKDLCEIYYSKKLNYFNSQSKYLH